MRDPPGQRVAGVIWTQSLVPTNGDSDNYRPRFTSSELRERACSWGAKPLEGVRPPPPWRSRPSPLEETPFHLHLFPLLQSWRPSRCVGASQAAREGKEVATAARGLGTGGDSRGRRAASLWPPVSTPACCEAQGHSASRARGPGHVTRTERRGHGPGSDLKLSFVSRGGAWRGVGAPREPPAPVGGHSPGQ